MRIRIDMEQAATASTELTDLGYCPHCNDRGERVTELDIVCKNGHSYTMATRVEHQRYFCPKDGCTSWRVTTERRLDGDGWCENKHQFKSSEFLPVVLPNRLEHSMGFCPTCNAHSAMREKRINGNDHCDNKHTYPSASARINPIGGYCQVENMKTTISFSLSRGNNQEHDTFVDGNKPNERCPLDSFLKKILSSAHGGVVSNDLRALPIITYSANGKYIAWFDTSEDVGFLLK